MIPSISVSTTQKITKLNSDPGTAWRKSLHNSIAFINSRITNSHKKHSRVQTQPSCKYSGISGQKLHRANLRFHHARLSSLSAFSLQHLRDSNLCLRHFDGRRLLLTCGNFLRKKYIYLFFLFSILRASSIAADVCQRRLLFAGRTLAVGIWGAGWLAGWHVGKITSGTETDGYISCSNNSCMFGRDTPARVGPLALSLR